MECKCNLFAFYRTASVFNKEGIANVSTIAILRRESSAEVRQALSTIYYVLWRRAQDRLCCRVGAIASTIDDRTRIDIRMVRNAVSSKGEGDV